MTSPEPQTQQAQQPEAQQAPAEQQEEKRTGGKVVHMHTAHPTVPIPYVTPGDLFSGARKATTTAASTAASTATNLLPSPRRLAFYGILGGMAVAGLIFGLELMQWERSRGVRLLATPGLRSRLFVRQAA
jgi:hypothetical protein